MISIETELILPESITSFLIEMIHSIVFRIQQQYVGIKVAVDIAGMFDMCLFPGHMAHLARMTGLGKVCPGLVDIHRELVFGFTAQEASSDDRNAENIDQIQCMTN